MSSAKSDRAGHLCSNCAAHEALQTRDLPKRRSRCARRFGGPGSAAHRIAPSRHRSWQRGFMRSRCAASGTQPLMQCRKPANLTRPTSPAGASHHDFFSPDIHRCRPNDLLEQGSYGRRRAVAPVSAPFALERILISQQNGPPSEPERKERQTLQFRLQARRAAARVLRSGWLSPGRGEASHTPCPRLEYRIDAQSTSS
jgi:hypothetical protein